MRKGFALKLSSCRKSVQRNRTRPGGAGRGSSGQLGVALIFLAEMAHSDTQRLALACGRADKRSRAQRRGKFGKRFAVIKCRRNNPGRKVFILLCSAKVRRYDWCVYVCVYVALARLEEKRTGLVGKPQDPRTITTDCGVVSKFVLISIVSGVSLIKIIGRLGVCPFGARN